MGGHFLVARDFLGPDEKDRTSFKERSRKMLPPLFRTPQTPQQKSAEEKTDLQSDFKRLSDANGDHSRDLEKLSTDENATDVDVTPQTRSIDETFRDKTASADTPNHSQNALTHLSKVNRIWRKSVRIFQAIVTVPTTIIVSAFVISVIPSLKGLFVTLPTSPAAPDGQPPLAVILDAATFLGGASVPLGLTGLGSALARIHVPRSEWKRLPFGSILGLAVGRMILQPILGVVIVQGLTRTGMISKDDKVLQFVSMYVTRLLFPRWIH